MNLVQIEYVKEILRNSAIPFHIDKQLWEMKVGRCKRYLEEDEKEIKQKNLRNYACQKRRKLQNEN